MIHGGNSMTMKCYTYIWVFTVIPGFFEMGLQRL